MDPVSIGIAISALGGVITAVGAIKQGAAAETAGEYNAAISTQNAGIAQQQGEIAVQQQQREGAQRIGSATAQYGASGLDVGQGSPLDVLRSSAEQSSLDASTIKYNYALKGMGYAQTAASELMAGETAKTSSYYTAAGQLLTTAGNTYSAVGQNEAAKAKAAADAAAASNKTRS